jgi:AraC-like DNA-binding protein
MGSFLRLANGPDLPDPLGPGIKRNMLLASYPAAALRQVVRHYYQMQGSLGGGTVSLQPVPARSPQILEFMFGTRYRVRVTGREKMVEVRDVALVGARTGRSAELILSGHVDAFTIVFQPGGFAALFGVPAIALTDRDFDARDVLGAPVRHLYERLGEVRAFGDRMRVADEVLQARATDDGWRTPVVKVAACIRQRCGAVRIGDLAAQAGLGVRQLERRFRYEIGMTPKLYARVIRFEAALELRARSRSSHWTDIAHQLGYHDQMHMVHDFTQLAGESPGAIADRLDMFVQPEVLSGRLAASR